LVLTLLNYGLSIISYKKYERINALKNTAYLMKSAKEVKFPRTSRVSIYLIIVLPAEALLDKFV